MDHGDPDASNQEGEKANDDNTGVGRSYECTFCKRGFTNAQALGGHMNIHRKDKAKAKAKHKNNQLEETSNKSNSRFMSSAEHHQQIGYQRPQMNYQLYWPSSNPSFQTGNYLPLWREPDRSDGRLDENLRLRMGTSPPADGEGGLVDSNVKENDVDLELRLGHDP